MSLANSNFGTSMTVVAGFLFLLILPIDPLLAVFQLGAFKTHYLGDAFKNIFILVFGSVVIKGTGYWKLKGWNQLLPNRPILFIVPLYFVLLGPLEYCLLGYQFHNFQAVNVSILLLAMLTVGWSEEIIFRGFVLSNLISGASSNQSLFTPIFLASLLFGVPALFQFISARCLLPLSTCPGYQCHYVWGWHLASSF